MNTLTFVSRQLDVFAGGRAAASRRTPPRTPPSTPTAERAPLRALHRYTVFSAGALPPPPPPPPHAAEDDDGAPPKRSQTWSRPFDAPPDLEDGPTASSSSSSSSSTRSPIGSLTRSLTSPHPIALPFPPPNLPPLVVPALGLGVPPGKRRRRSRSGSTASSSAFRAHGGGSAHAHALFTRVFMRVLVFLWEGLCDTWAALAAAAAAALGTGKGRAQGGVGPDAGESTDEKESEDESGSSSADEKTALLPSAPALLKPTKPLLTRPATSPTGSPTLTLVPPSPPPVPRKTPFQLLPMTLVLDLDETLIHSTSRPMAYPRSSGTGRLLLDRIGLGPARPAPYVVEVMLGGRRTQYHVHKRPFVDYFLRKVSTWYTLVVFTASMKEYADPVIDWLDAGSGILSRRLFRESCTQLANGAYSKDLSVVEADLARVCLVDNSPICYSLNESNGIPIEGWTHDPSDEALLDLLPVLDSLRFTSDVRRVLSLRGFASAFAAAHRA